MTEIKDTNYFSISGWMVKKLGLSGNELMVYAIIYCFTQDRESEFCGSRSYIASFINASKRTVDSVLASLQAKQLIEKHTSTKNGVTTNTYSLCNSFTGGAEIAGGVEETAPNNKEDSKEKENYIKETETQPTVTLIANNEKQELQQGAKKGTDTIVISVSQDIYPQIKLMYEKCGYKAKASGHRTETEKRIKAICTNKSKAKRLHPLQILLSYGAYLAECRNSDKEIKFVKQSDTFLSSMVYDYADMVDDFEERAVRKYGDGWKNYKVVE